MQNKIILALFVTIWLASWLFLIYNSQDSVDREIKRLYNEQSNIAMQKKLKKIDEETYLKKFNDWIAIATWAIEEIEKIKKEIIELDKTNWMIYKEIQRVTLWDTEINVEELKNVLVETLSFIEDR